MRVLCSIAAIAACATSPAAIAAPCQIKQLAELQVETTNNRPIVDGTVNGQPVKILIDTGASISAITGALAKQLGLKTETQSRLHIYGVGGEKHVDATRIKKLQFGNFLLTGLTVAVMSPQKSLATEAREGLFIVGSDLLSRYTMEFDFGNHVMRFMAAENCKPEQLVYWSKTFSVGEMETSRIDDAHIETQVLLNGKSVDALLDTGAQVSWSTTYGARLAGVTNSAADHPVENRLRGSNGAPLPSFLGTFETISIGDDETVRNVKLWVADLFAADTSAETGSHILKPVEGSPNLLIGCDFFLAHRVIASFKDHKILFTYNGGPVFQASGKPPTQGERLERMSEAANAGDPPP
jgi:predicted aspartyl protease